MKTRILAFTLIIATAACAPTTQTAPRPPAPKIDSPEVASPISRSALINTLLSYMAQHDVLVTDTAACRMILEKADDINDALPECGDRWATTYADSASIAHMNDALAATYEGIGAIVQRDSVAEAIRIIFVFPNSPAQRVGLQKEDLIIAIAGESTQTFSAADAVRRIKGPPGTTVSLTIHRANQRLTVQVAREKIERKTVESFLLNGSIGYIYLRSFGENSHREFGAALAALERAGMGDKLIIDLRYNRGGYMSAALNILASHFAPEKNALMITTRSTRGERHYDANNRGDRADMHIAVITNQQSASASELTTGTLQSWGNTIVVGDTTFGKGVAQAYFRTKIEGEPVVFKLTMSEYYVGASKTKVHEVGVIPDFPLQISRDSIAPYAPLPPHEHFPDITTFMYPGERIPDISIDPQLKLALDQLLLISP